MHCLHSNAFSSDKDSGGTIIIKCCNRHDDISSQNSTFNDVNIIDKTFDKIIFLVMNASIALIVLALGLYLAERI